MRELGRLFRTFCADAHNTWVRHVPQIEKLPNITTHLSTGYAPYELQFGKRPQNELEQLLSFPDTTEDSHDHKILLANERILKNFDKRRGTQRSVPNVPLEVGDLVLLRVPYPSSAIDKVTAKFFHLYYGPYRLSKKYGENAFRLVDPNDTTIEKGTYNRISLRKYHLPAQMSCTHACAMSADVWE